MWPFRRRKDPEPEALLIFDPKPDITAFELAQIMRSFLAPYASRRGIYGSPEDVEKLFPPEVGRHFTGVVPKGNR